MPLEPSEFWWSEHTFGRIEGFAAGPSFARRSAKSASSLNCLQRTRKTLQIGPFSHIVDLALKAAGEELTKRGGAVVGKS